jgi:hypothetical protein
MRDHHGKVVKDENGETVYLDPRWPFIFVQCGLQPPHLEKEPRCYDMPGQGVLVPAGQMNDLQGTHPVWTANDMIAYKGCNSWAGLPLVASIL